MAYRIEITFAGEALADELARARILAAPEVVTAMESLTAALASAGMTATVTAHSINSVPRPKKATDLRHRVAAE